LSASLSDDQPALFIVVVLTSTRPTLNAVEQNRRCNIP